MKRVFSVGIAVASAALISLRAAESDEGFTTIFNGQTFAGWKASIDHTNTWKIEDGAFVTRGETAHLFYVGETNAFKNFDL